MVIEYSRSILLIIPELRAQWQPQSIQTDKVLAEHYGFNEEELDFIINPYYEFMDTSYHEFFRFRIELQSISKDLYLYLRTYSAQWEIGDDFFAEPVIIHSNVSDGLGIFGASASSYQNLAYGSYPVDEVYYLRDDEYYDY